MEILSESIDRELPDLAAQGVRTRFFGRRDRLEPWLEEKMANARAHDRASRHPRAVDRIRLRRPCGDRRTRRVAWPRTGSTRPTIDEDALAARLYAPELREIDLLVRTSGELRLSNFMLWEAAYAELVFTETLWPDFGEDDLRAAVEAYAARSGASEREPPREPLRLAARDRRDPAPDRPRHRLARRLVAVRARRSSAACSRSTSCMRWRAACARSCSAGTRG